MNKILQKFSTRGSNLPYRFATVVFALIMSLAANNAAFAQTLKVTGKVTDINNEPIIGATVSVKGTNNATMTDVSGNFAIDKVPSNGVLLFTYVGYNNKEAAVEGRKEINMVMEESVIGLDNVIVIGYGKTTQRNLASSVSTIKAEAIVGTPVTNITQGLAGRASGLIVVGNGGGINQKDNISIRGGGTPLIVINGVISSYNDFALINSEDIASLNILKDAAATAVYGAIGGDGAIVITTKTGRGKTTFNVTADFMLTQPTLLEGKLDSYQRAVAMNNLQDMYGLAPTYSQDQLNKYLDGSDPLNYGNFDWQKAALNTFAPQQKYNITAQGGDENNNYYLSLGILDQGTIFKANTNDQQRYNFRFAQNSYINEIGLRISPSIEGYQEETRAPLNTTAPGGIDNYYYYVFGHVQNKSPEQNGLNPFGQIYSGTTDNPLAEMSADGGYHKRSATRLRGQLELNWALPWVEGLELRATGNYSANFQADKSWNASTPVYDWQGKLSPAAPMSLSKSSSRSYQYTLQYFGSYRRKFDDKHDVDVTAGYEASYGWGESLLAARSGFLIPIDQMSSGPASSQTNGSGEGVSIANAGYIGRAKYIYDDRYLAEVTMRYDGSDLFPPDKRWGLFYSGSLAWTISNEKFFQNSKLASVVNFLKLRASYGQTGLVHLDGNGNPIRWEYLSSYGYNANGYIIDGKIYPIFGEGALPSPDITWYQRNTLDYGLDFELLQGRLKGSVDYFYMVTKNYLASPSATSYTSPLGISLPTVLSKGEHRREGFDFSLSWNDNLADFTYNVGMNFTYFDQLNAVNWSESEASIKNPYKRTTQQTGYWGTGYKSLGFYTSSEDVMNNPRRIVNNLLPGDLNYADLNGDGNVDGEDQWRIGKSSFPRANYGIFLNLGYKGAFLNILFQGASRRDIQIAADLRSGVGAQNRFIYGYQLDFWTPDNQGAKYPRLQNSNKFDNANHNVSPASDFWNVNAAYFRLKTVELGYDFKKVLLNNAKWISNLRLSLSGNNVFTISDAVKYGYDPETASTAGYGYPVVRTYAMRLSLGF
ncbi:SusC/RagA family TonB-linked outer membrane protein [Mucinivorans hirudinis]|uniref:SusC/RagA family TonB-linked outer membrane protein n=1 Tax=Mucinivorans hirudinis TaxID=1433126 RepID=A0A060R7C6_9BACT|nr:SusC/RagA family TonB-linked outer membrane protein [Mucinivorans hirudinis]